MIDNVVAGLGLGVVGAHIAVAIVRPDLRQQGPWRRFVVYYLGIPILALGCLMIRIGMPSYLVVPGQLR